MSMSNREIWTCASELYGRLGSTAKIFALRQAVHAKRNANQERMDDWLIVASRIRLVATLH
jgi:hypothetical protein